MASRLEQLKALSATAFEKAESKEQIDLMAQIKDCIDGVEAEQSALMQKCDEYKASYKDAVMHQSFKETKEVESVPGPKPILSVEDALAQFIANTKE